MRRVVRTFSEETNQPLMTIPGVTSIPPSVLKGLCQRVNVIPEPMPPFEFSANIRIAELRILLLPFICVREELFPFRWASTLPFAEVFGPRSIQVVRPPPSEKLP